MPAKTKQQNLDAARRLYFAHPAGLTDIELSDRLGVNRSTGYRYRIELGAVEVSEGRYTLRPTESELELARLILAAQDAPKE